MKNLRIKRLLAMTAVCIVLAGSALAKIDLVTLPAGKKVQLTIYNSADLTLVRDERELTMKKGDNVLQFSWAGTLIDPTSLDMMPKKFADKIERRPGGKSDNPPRFQELVRRRISASCARNVPNRVRMLG